MIGQMESELERAIEDLITARQAIMAVVQSHQAPGGSLAGKLVLQPAQSPGELKPTPEEIDGPYFRLGAPMRSSLLEPGDKPELVLSGRVLNEQGTPIPDAIVNLWSSDAIGNYDMVGYRYTGYVVTDTEGRYEFTTIIPGCYYPRDAKHLHVKVQGDSSPLTTQLYIEGEPRNEDDPLYTPECLVRCTVDPTGTKHGTFDFVIRQVSERQNVTADSLAARV